ncbi:unnamed protein product [Hymenolepis diminuta]|uniref:Uncharacterized protein n=1 Tax=Hymenolepis diminuta TaxID=6216 RepID=A0A564Y4E8_HYMDI|nr:unnamed protein product [Hymenolepis diminuta]
MGTRYVIFLLVLCITTCIARTSQTSLSTQDVTAKRSVKSNQEVEKPPGETSGEGGIKNPSDTDEKNPENPDGANGDQDKTEKPSDDNINETSTTSKSSRTSYGLAISLSSLLIPFVFYI